MGPEVVRGFERQAYCMHAYASLFMLPWHQLDLLPHHYCEPFDSFFKPLNSKTSCSKWPVSISKKIFLARDGWRHHPLLKIAFIEAGDVTIVSENGDHFKRWAWWHDLLLKIIFRDRWWHDMPYKWSCANKFITFSYIFGWSQTLYQNYWGWRDLKFCSW